MPIDDVCWESVYFFVKGSLDQFLIREINPFLNDAKNKTKIKQFFFIRYWENGPHIRLRLKGNRAELVSCIESSFGKKTIKGKNYRLSDYRYVPYIPEIDRYGGIDALPVCESQFQLSSEVALTILDSIDPDVYENKLGISLQLQLIFMKGCGMGDVKALSIVKSLQSSWMRHATRGNRLSSEEVLWAFENTYTPQAMEMNKILENIWLASLADFEDELVFKKWIHGNISVRNILTDKLLPNQIYNVLQSLMHMLNNRLGVTNQDEAYQGFILSKFFERRLSQ